MKTIITISDNWPEITESDVMNIITNPEKYIHIGRNRLWRTQVLRHVLAVKQFKTDIRSRIAYSIARSKAQRSFAHACELMRRGVDTPTPVAYVEQRGAAGMLIGSWYICVYTEAPPLVEALHKYGRECLDDFAVFTANLHSKGIRHDDLNNTNVRIEIKNDGGFDFSLIDLNRMKIYPQGMPVPLDECLKNICRFCPFDDNYLYFLKSYLVASKLPEGLYAEAIEVKKRHDKAGRRKNLIKKLFRK